jgi:hypothetical protein
MKNCCAHCIIWWAWVRLPVWKQKSLWLLHLLDCVTVCVLMLILNGSDPFDGHDCPVFKKLGSMIQWHPRISEGKFPIWLKDYNVVHFIGTEPTAHSHSVHILFHEQFQDTDDRFMILSCLCIGHTIALFTPDNELAVSALTFVHSANCAIVLFLLLIRGSSALDTGHFCLIWCFMFYVLLTRQRHFSVLES